METLVQKIIAQKPDEFGNTWDTNLCIQKSYGRKITFADNFTNIIDKDCWQNNEKQDIIDIVDKLSLYESVIVIGFDSADVVGKRINEIIPDIEKETVQIFRHIDRGNKVIKGKINAYKKYSQANELDEAFGALIGKSANYREALIVAAKAAETRSTVLIRGESGTGKELVAKAVHMASKRKNQPLIRINCPAIPVNLMESELFGHEKGSFTGAIYQKIGKFELAHEGTIILDEVGDLDNNMQAKLLRVLQEKEFERVGGTQTIKVDVRIIAATNRNLEKLVERGEFREDLYYRLNVIPINLPSLRERKQDIPELVQHFIKKLSLETGKYKKGIASQVLRYLVNYDWPGNIRELENVIERAINLSEHDIINMQDIPTNITGCKMRTDQSLINLKEDGSLASFDEYDKEIIKQALEKYNSFNAAGKALGITHKTVAAKARRFGLMP